MSNEVAASFGAKKHHIGDYIPLRSIGKGSFAEVKLARHSLTGTKVAFKTISRWGLTAEFEEMKSLKTLRHPNIVALFEVITTQDKHILFMEHASGGDLFDHLRKCGRKREHEARPLFRQMISALQYCHQRGIAHRDLKTENILLDEQLNVKVADFGFSRDFTNYQLTTVCGTFCYMAPEILERQVYDGRKTDVWSLGVILYRMITGEYLFVGDTEAKVRKEIQGKKLHLPGFTSREVQDLLQQMLTVDSRQRPTLDDIMKHPWVNLGEDEEMRPYREPPWGDIDPQVAKVMKAMGFKKQEIQESLSQHKYDRVMGTYLILRMKTTKMQGSTIKVRPCPSSDPSTSTACSQEVETSTPSSSPASSLDSSSSASPGSKKARKKDPRPTVQVRKSPPPPGLDSSSPSSTCIPGEKVPTPPPGLQSSSSSSTSIPEETVPAPPPSLQSSSSSSTFIPEEMVPAPPPSLQSSSSSSTSIPEETVPAPPPGLQSSSSSSTFIPEETVPAPPPGLQSSSSSSTFIPEETVPAQPPSLQSSSSSSTFIPEETVPAPPPSLQSSCSSSTFIPGETVPSPPPSLQSSCSSSTCIPGETVPVPPPSLLSSSLTYSPALRARSTTPVLGPQSGTATPSPDLQGDPEGSPTTHSSSKSSSFQVSELGGGTPGSPSHPHHGRQGVARRVLRFLLTCICCGPSTRKRRVLPM